jgi:putative colanic acid biosysnthesis UDP-glucose lipid carrier transferase
VSIQNDSFPALSGVFPASDGVRPAPAVTRRVSVKRVLDVVLSLAAFFVFLPVLAIILVAVVLDSRGPAFFRQRRVGQYGKVFNIYKFRSMHVLEDGAQVVQACEGDARITRVGKFLRITSLDELPQLLNVLAGDMSLVGPRPHAVAHDEYYSARIANYRLRHMVKPGITGWAQVNGARGGTPRLCDMQARIDLDVHYIERESLWLDLQILARTPFEVARRRNAV